MKISILSLLCLSAVADCAALEGRKLNETGELTGGAAELEEGDCDEQNAALVGVTEISTTWSAVEDLIVTQCSEEEEGCEESKTGKKIIWTYDFGTVADSNEAEVYTEACNSVSSEREVVHTMEETVILSCTAETADHIPYEVHLVDYFQCTGFACDDDELPMDVAIAFAERVIDEKQEGVTCQLGPHSGASAATFSFAIMFAAATAMLALI